MKGIFYILLLIPTVVFSQSPAKDFLEEIQGYNASNLWTLNRIPIEYDAWNEIENDTSTLKRPEPIGYIGDSFQRFHIHFISAIQNPNKPLEYFIYGKTKVKENICSFQGTIKIDSAGLYLESDVPNIPLVKQGVISGEYRFYEDQKQPGSGMLSGRFTTYFYIDDDYVLEYDAITSLADGYKNNQFEGTWLSYSTGKGKKCNWGDYRIPDSKALDDGVGSFWPNMNYLENGWESYASAIAARTTEQSHAAIEKEAEKWWED